MTNNDQAARAGDGNAADLIEAVEAYLEAQGALDNRELMGPNALPYDDLRRACNRAYEALDDALHAAKLAAAPAVSAPAVDVERLIRECLPGGHSCDPQRVADEIRAWFQAPAAAPAATLTLSGEMHTMGDMGADDMPQPETPRVVIGLADGRNLMVIGLTRDEVVALAPHFLERVTVQVGAAVQAPATGDTTHG